MQLQWLEPLASRGPWTPSPFQEAHPCLILAGVPQWTVGTPRARRPARGPCSPRRNPSTTASSSVAAAASKDKGPRIESRNICLQLRQQLLFDSPLSHVLPHRQSGNGLLVHTRAAVAAAGLGWARARAAARPRPPAEPPAAQSATARARAGGTAALRRHAIARGDRSRGGEARAEMARGPQGAWGCKVERWARGLHRP